LKRKALPIETPWSLLVAVGTFQVRVLGHFESSRKPKLTRGALKTVSRHVPTQFVRTSCCDQA
jgi:hypothetical protein